MIIKGLVVFLYGRLLIHTCGRLGVSADRLHLTSSLKTSYRTNDLFVLKVAKLLLYTDPNHYIVSRV